MQTFVIATVALVAGLIVGTLYGRKVEQQVVGTTLADFAKVDSAAASAVSRLHVRFAWLKKYVGSKL